MSNGSSGEIGQLERVLIRGSVIPAQKQAQVDLVLVPISALDVAGSPRVAGESAEHIRLLIEADVDLPPIMVHRQTMRVIDGVHRLRVAETRGQSEIAVEFFDGDEDEAFVEAVKANLAHGLPLSLADRRAAAARILGRHPEWSDRGVAKTVGLSADTVGVIRREADLDPAEPNVRIGRDGRARPVDSTEGRLRAGELLASYPDASLRQVARDAGIAVGTVRDVRERLRRGEDLVPSKRQATDQRPAVPVTPRRVPNEAVTQVGLLSILRKLKDDPSLKFSDTGRRLLRWLDLHALSPEDTTWAVPAVPSHCANRIAELARGYATIWHEYAEVLERRVQREGL